MTNEQLKNYSENQSRQGGKCKLLSPSVDDLGLDVSVLMELEDITGYYGTKEPPNQLIKS